MKIGLFFNLNPFLSGGILRPLRPTVWVTQGSAPAHSRSQRKFLSACHRNIYRRRGFKAPFRSMLGLVRLDPTTRWPESGFEPRTSASGKSIPYRLSYLDLADYPSHMSLGSASQNDLLDWCHRP